MSREPPLTESDVDAYVRHLPQITALREDPSGLPGLLSSTGWTESRLAYVATKAGLSLLGSLDPQALEAKAAPPFAVPTPAEEALVLSREADIAKAFAQIIRAAREKDSPRPPARRGGRRGG
jgi:hypothetical protein